MDTLSRSAALFGLAALSLGTLAATPANAKATAFVRYTQRHKASRLDRQAAHAAYDGDYRRASRLRHRATQLHVSTHHRC